MTLWYRHLIAARVHKKGRGSKVEKSLQNLCLVKLDSMIFMFNIKFNLVKIYIERLSMHLCTHLIQFQNRVMDE